MSPSVTSSPNHDDLDDPNEFLVEDDGEGGEELPEAPVQQKRKGGRKPIYATPEERKQRNRQAQAAFRERRTEYIRQLEVALKQNEDTITALRDTHRIATNECLRLRYRNSLLENILLEHGIDLQRELQTRTSSPPMRLPQKSPVSAYPPTAQRAMMNRHQQAKRKASSEASTKPSVKSDMPPEHAGQTSSEVLFSPLEDSLSFASLDLSNSPSQPMDPFTPDLSLYSANPSAMMDQIMQQPFAGSQMPYSPAATTSDRSELIDANRHRDAKHHRHFSMPSRGLASPIDMRNGLDYLDPGQPKRPRVIAALPDDEAEPFDDHASLYLPDPIQLQRPTLPRPPASARSLKQHNHNNTAPISETSSSLAQDRNSGNFQIENPLQDAFSKSSHFYRAPSFANQPPPPWG